MKIIEHYNIDGILVTEIPHGDIFVYGGSYYMRVQKNPEWDILSRNVEGDTNIVAVDLANGTLAVVPWTEKVVPIYAKIRINGRTD